MAGLCWRGSEQSGTSHRARGVPSPISRAGPLPRSGGACLTQSPSPPAPRLSRGGQCYCWGRVLP